MIDLSRFHAVDAAIHAQALAEVIAGRKVSHWMWFVFPQLRGLGRSPTALHYGLTAEEAAPFLADPLLGPRLVQITRALLAHAGQRSATAILGPVDALKLCSSMTLFAAVPGPIRSLPPCWPHSATGLARRHLHCCGMGRAASWLSRRSGYSSVSGSRVGLFFSVRQSHWARASEWEWV